MSNYSQIVYYGPKDTLSNGDPNKYIKGVQIDAELAAISSAITSKQDSSTAVTTSSGTFTGSFSGCTGSVTCTFKYLIVGSMCTVYTPSSAFGTSNLTTISLSGMAAAVIPVSPTWIALPYGSFTDNGANAFNPGIWVNSTAWPIYKNGVNNGWTNSGQKGLVEPISFTYSLV